MLPVWMMKYAISIIASITMNVIVVILPLTILILLILTANSVLSLSDMDTEKKLFMNFKVLTSNFLPPQFPNKLPLYFSNSTPVHIAWMFLTYPTKKINAFLLDCQTY